MDPILVAYVADELEFTNPDLTYDEAASHALALLEFDPSLGEAARKFGLNLLSRADFAASVGATREAFIGKETQA